jgi:MFS family permease
VLEGVDAALTRFTVADLFLDKSVRPRLIAAFLMMLSLTFGFWRVATFVPTYVGTVASKMGLDAPHYAAVAGLLGTGVAICGFITLGFLADAIGRKPDGDTVLHDVPGADPSGLSVDGFDGLVARRGHGLRLLHRRHLVMGADLVTRIVPDSDARHRRRLLL